jgi:hypothetical protein
MRKTKRTRVRAERNDASRAAQFHARCTAAIKTFVLRTSDGRVARSKLRATADIFFPPAGADHA